MEEHRDLWQELWKYDPNALVVVNPRMEVLIVNPAFCRMFLVSAERVVGMNLERLLGDIEEFRAIYAENRVVEGMTKRFPAYGLTVRMVAFALKQRGMLAAIFHDVTNEEKQRDELQRIREHAAQKVNDVVEAQMRVVQEVAGLLGEAVANTRVSLYQLIRTIEAEED
ncbi:MAG TPA: PAS domain-containing protein [Acidobacteriota bacterium]|nr:PAS domain-containing protein [bacterium]HNX19820.1 PAS domain-containing protein [Acidobacteriota bacterium]